MIPAIKIKLLEVNDFIPILTRLSGMKQLKRFTDWDYSKKSDLKRFSNRFTRKMGKALILEQLNDLTLSEADYSDSEQLPRNPH